MAKRIGITMRVDIASGHNERRDCLAQDWAKYMANVSPDTFWMPLPNLGEAIADYVRQWQLDGVIFSGGNDLGSCQLRDCTEFTLAWPGASNSSKSARRWIGCTVAT